MGEGRAWTINLMSALCAMQAEQHFFVFIYFFIFFIFIFLDLDFSSGFRVMFLAFRYHNCLGKPLW